MSIGWIGPLASIVCIGNPQANDRKHDLGEYYICGRSHWWWLVVLCLASALAGGMFVGTGDYKWQLLCLDSNCGSMMNDGSMMVDYIFIHAT